MLQFLKNQTSFFNSVSCKKVNIQFNLTCWPYSPAIAQNLNKRGRFIKTSYQNRAVENISENEQVNIQLKELYEVEVEALQKAKWNKKYSKINIDQLLLDQIQLNTDLQRPEWVPIYHYKNKNLDYYTEDDLTKMLPLPARAISKDYNKLTFQNCTVEEYDKNDQRFIVIFQNNQKRSLKRIYICFDKKDPRLFSQRVINFKKYLMLIKEDCKQKVQSEINTILNTCHQIKNYFLNNQKKMQQEVLHITQNGILLIQHLQFKKFKKNMLQNQIKQHSKNAWKQENLIHYLKIQKFHQKVTKIVLIMDFANQMHLKESRKFKILKEIRLSMLNLNILIQILKTLALYLFLLQKSFYVKNESVKAIQEIKCYCEDDLKNTFFNVNIDYKYKLEEFKNCQDLQISHNTFNILKMNRPTQIFSTIQKQFGSITFGKYKISDNLDDFEKSKLKKFLLVDKILMQNTISQLTRKIYYEFVSYIKERVPVQTIIEGVDSVKNIYQDGSTKTRDPIFLVDILKSLQNNEFIYSSNPQFHKAIIMTVFNKAAIDIQKFQNVESKVINELIKISVRKENILKVPFITKKFLRRNHLRLYRKILNQENAWLWKLREEQKEYIAEGVKTLDIYLQTFHIYKDILSINPIEFRENMKNLERPREIHEIQSKIKKFNQKQKKFQQLNLFVLLIQVKVT